MNYELETKKHNELLLNIKTNIVELKNVYTKILDHWVYEDLIYRYYHQSYKVYYIQDYTKQIVDVLMKCAPESTEMNSDFKRIFEAGQSIKFKSSHNQNWDKHTKPLLEAFFHAKYFLEMIIKYGEKYETAPEELDSGWASVLYFYNLR